jgi:hypothetical protein
VSCLTKSEETLKRQGDDPITCRQHDKILQTKRNENMNWERLMLFLVICHVDFEHG